MSRSDPRAVRGVLLALSCLIAGAVAPGEALASSCCAGGGGQSICVLPSEQSYQLGLSTSVREVQGHFDAFGEYSANPDGVTSRTVTTVIGAAARFHEDWQAGLSVPVVTNRYRFPGKSAAATGMGDPAMEARYTLWEDLSFLKYRPQLSFYGGMRFPLGVSVYDSADPYGANIVGDGTYTAHAGLNAAKILHPVKLSLDGAFFYPVSQSVRRMRGAAVAAPYALKEGNRFQLLESATYLVSDHWSGTGGLRQLWIFQSSMDGRAIDGSAARLFSTTASVNYFHDASWSFSLGYETAFPFYRYLVNQANAQSVSLSAVYGGF